jgi:hypothetical protein
MFKLRIETKNAAFSEYPHRELARLLEIAMRRLENNVDEWIP